MENFGRNVTITPESQYFPRDDNEVLEILNRHRGQQIRAIGRTHSWSRAVEANSILLDLRHLNSVDIDAAGDEPSAWVGAGCQIKHLLSEVRRKAGLTLPSV